MDDVSICWQMFNFVLSSQKRWFQFNSRIVRTHFASVMALNNCEITKFSLSSTSFYLKPPTSSLRPLIAERLKISTLRRDESPSTIFLLLLLIKSHKHFQPTSIFFLTAFPIYGKHRASELHYTSKLYSLYT